MKTKYILTLMLAWLLFSLPSFAKKDIEAIKEETITEYGKQIDVTYFYVGTKTISRHTKHKVDHQNNYIESISYDWNSETGWTPTVRLDYSYTSQNVLESITTSKWNSRQKCWGVDEKTSFYLPNANGGYDVAQVVDRKRR